MNLTDTLPAALEISALRLSGVRHGFFGRAGGRSHGIYTSNNCGFGSGDDRETARKHLIDLFDVLSPDDPRVAKARRRLASALF